MSLLYDITEKEGDVVSVTVFRGKDNYIATQEHPSFTKIVETLRDPRGVGDEARLIGLFDIGKGIIDGFSTLTERVSIGAGKLLLDGDPMNDGLATAILRYHSEGHDFMPLALFLEKLMTNPNEHSREHLFRWITKHHFAIADDGDFYAYKSVGEKGGEFRSKTAGEAFVNGQKYKGRIPNKPGTVVEMPRSEVKFNPHQGCSTGLHVANWDFARGFASGSMLRLKVNPRDVVSVPVDAGDQKMRVCRYKVDAEVTTELTTALYVGEPERTARHLPLDGAVLPSEKKEAAARKVRRRTVTEFPEFMEDYKLSHMLAENVTTLRWLAREWGVPIRNQNHDQLAHALAKVARRRRKEIADYEASRGKYVYRGAK